MPTSLYISTMNNNGNVLLIFKTEKEAYKQVCAYLLKHLFDLYDGHLACNKEVYQLPKDLSDLMNPEKCEAMFTQIQAYYTEWMNDQRNKFARYSEYRDEVTSMIEILGFIAACKYEEAAKTYKKNLDYVARYQWNITSEFAEVNLNP